MAPRVALLTLLVACGVAFGISGNAKDSEEKECQRALPGPFSQGQPHLLNDPRTGLMLYVESDGRHMSAITHQGKIVWHRDLFADPKLVRDVLIPPPPIPGTPEISDEEFRRHAHAYVARLSIDRIDVEADCAMTFIDHHLPANLRRHYIRAGSGTHIFWLLDAATGDFQMEEIN